MCFQQHDFFDDFGWSFEPIERGIAATRKTRLTRLASQIPDLFSRPMRPIRYQRMNRLVSDPIVITIWVQTGMPLGDALLRTPPLPFFISLQGITVCEQASTPALLLSPACSFWQDGQSFSPFGFTYRIFGVWSAFGLGRRNDSRWMNHFFRRNCANSRRNSATTNTSKTISVVFKGLFLLLGFAKRLSYHVFLSQVVIPSGLGLELDEGRPGFCIQNSVFSFLRASHQHTVLFFIRNT